MWDLEILSGRTLECRPSFNSDLSNHTDLYSKNKLVKFGICTTPQPKKYILYVTAVLAIFLCQKRMFLQILWYEVDILDKLAQQKFDEEKRALNSRRKRYSNSSFGKVFSMNIPAFVLPLHPYHADPQCSASKNRFVCSHLAPSASTRRMPPIFFVLGGPGSGKGTQCNFLKNDYDVQQICVGDLLRREATRGTSLGKSIDDIMQRGEIVPGKITMTLLSEELAQLAGMCEGVLIDGFPRAMDQAIDFENMISTCKFVIYFHCARKVMIERLLNRGKTSGRADDDEDVVTKRLSTFEEKTLPVVNHFRQRGLLREIDSSSGTPEQVYEKTRIVFKEAFS